MVCMLWQPHVYWVSVTTNAIYYVHLTPRWNLVLDPCPPLPRPDLLPGQLPPVRDRVRSFWQPGLLDRLQQTLHRQKRGLLLLELRHVVAGGGGPGPGPWRPPGQGSYIPPDQAGFSSLSLNTRVCLLLFVMVNLRRRYFSVTLI